MIKAWHTGQTLYVYIKKRYRKGILKSRNNAKWDFLPHGYSKTIRICPFHNKWHYAFESNIVKWPHKISILFYHNSIQPFKHTKERYGRWTGAICSRTISRKITVWQIPNTEKVIVGHLGTYTLATIENNKLVKHCQMATQNEIFFIGKGTLNKKRFKTLKIVDKTNIKRDKRLMRVYTKPLYTIPTRDELG